MFALNVMQEGCGKTQGKQGVRAIPYKLSADYLELLSRLRNEEVIVGFVDNPYTDENATHTDVIQLLIESDTVKGFVRGKGYLTITDLDVRLSGCNTLEDYFMAVCESLNLGWVKP